jgi:hypothetical protein
MSFDYAGLRDNTATKLIARFGRLHTFTRVTYGAFDPATGTSAETSATFTANAVKEEFSAFERNDSSIQVDDVKFIAEAVSNGFEVDDSITIESQQYKLTRVNPIKPGAVVVAWELQARK